MKTFLGITTSILALLQQARSWPPRVHAKDEHLEQFKQHCGDKVGCWHASNDYVTYNFDDGIPLTYEGNENNHYRTPLDDLARHLNRVNDTCANRTRCAYSSHHYLSYKPNNRSTFTYQLNGRQYQQQQRSLCAQVLLADTQMRKASMMRQFRNGLQLTEVSIEQLIKLACDQRRPEDASFTPRNTTVNHSHEIDSMPCSRRHTHHIIEFESSSGNYRRAYFNQNNIKRFLPHKDQRERVDLIPLHQMIERTCCPATENIAETRFDFSRFFTGSASADAVANTPQEFTISFNNYGQRPANMNMTLKLPRHLGKNPAYLQLNACLKQRQPQCHFMGTWNDLFNMDIENFNYCPETELDYQKNMVIRFTSENYYRKCFVQMQLNLNEFFVVFPIGIDGQWVEDALHNTAITLTHPNTRIPSFNTAIRCGDNARFALSIQSLDPRVELTFTHCPSTPTTDVSQRLKIQIDHNISEYGTYFIPYQYSTLPSPDCQKPFTRDRQFRLSIWPNALTAADRVSSLDSCPRYLPSRNNQFRFSIWSKAITTLDTCPTDLPTLDHIPVKMHTVNEPGGVEKVRHRRAIRC